MITGIDESDSTRSQSPDAPLPPLSALELALVEEGSTARDALSAVVTLARRADQLGFRRAWLAEHHGYRSVGSVAPPILAGYLATQTTGIRVGSGGVLLPHHAPLVVAEQFTTLSALHPGRIDLGIARGPGATDSRILRALRSSGRSYRTDLVDLLGYLAGTNGVDVLPGANTTAEPWLLASSTDGAELAAELGLPLAFGYHIRPGNAVEALTRYRDRFHPSRWRPTPYVLVSVETICAASDSEAAALGGPARLTMAAALRGRGHDAPLPTVARAESESLPPELAERLSRMAAVQAHGSPDTVRRRLATIAELTGADELMLSTPIYSPAARVRSLELIAAQSRRQGDRPITSNSR